MVINVRREEIVEFCHRHHVKKLSFCGSVLKEDFRDVSDVDVLVEFEPYYIVGLHIIEIEEELSKILGSHKVDMVSEKHLNHLLRDRILQTAQVQYAEG